VSCGKVVRLLQKVLHACVPSIGGWRDNTPKLAAPFAPVRSEAGRTATSLPEFWFFSAKHSSWQRGATLLGDCVPSTLPALSASR
jgi:hypothetical protein